MKSETRHIMLLAITVLVLLVNSLAYADNIFVSSSDGTIRKFDSSGNGSVFASGLGATGLAFDSSGNLYASTGNGIMKFDSSGNGTIFASGLSGTDIAFDSSNNLYVASWTSGEIMKLDSSGNSTLFASISDPLFSVTDLTFDSSGYLYASTEEGGGYPGKIKKFDSSGNGTNFLTFSHSDNWSNPYQYGLATDSSGNLFVANNFRTPDPQQRLYIADVTKYDLNGNSIFSVGLYGSSYPFRMGLAFDSSDNLYVAAKNTIFKLDSTSEYGDITTFATGLSSPNYIAVQFVPEPATLLLLGMGGLALLRKRKAE